MTRTMCDVLLLNSLATNYPTTYKGESVIEILELIFNDHEAQLKAKDEEIEKYKSLHNLAKGRLNKASEYTSILEEQLKAKDEKIERLKRNDLGLMLKESYENSLEKEAKKARSIVAMLFWEWRKHHRMYYESSKARNPSALTHLNSATLSKLMFKQAYKMSKDIK